MRDARLTRHRSRAQAHTAALAAAMAWLAASAPAAAAGGEPDALELSFLPPAVGGPAVAAEGSGWLLVVFGEPAAPGSPFAGSIAQAVPPQWSTITESEVEWEAPGVGNITSPRAPVESAHAAPALAGGVAQDGAGSLLVWADRIAWEAGGAAVALRPRPDGACLGSFVGPDARDARLGRFMEHCPPGGPDAQADALPAGAMAVRVRAEGVRLLESHGLAFACSRADACPDGGDRRVEQVGPDPVPARQTSYDYQRLAWRDGDAALDLEGEALTVLASAAGAALAVDGSMRFPLANGAACPDCVLVDGQTLLLSGRVEMGGLSVAPDGSMRAAVRGDLAAARLDEAAVSSAELFGAAAAAVGVGAVVGVTLKLFGPLLAHRRWTEARLLEQPTRKQVLGHVLEKPGATPGEIQRVTGLASTVVRHHLSLLVRYGVIARRQDGQAQRFFENHGRFDRTWAEVSVRRDPDLDRLYRYVVANPGARQRHAVLAACAAWGWGRSTAEYRLGVLERSGLVRAVREGRGKRLWPTGSAALEGAARAASGAADALPEASAALS